LGYLKLVRIINFEKLFRGKKEVKFFF